jgi:hypothetical protein
MPLSVLLRELLPLDFRLDLFLMQMTYIPVFSCLKLYLFARGIIIEDDEVRGCVLILPDAPLASAG